MCDTTFAFGQRGNHFIQCPSRLHHTRLPKKLQSLLSSNQISQIYHVALGCENSFLLAYRDKKGKDHLESQDLPPEISEFIYARNKHNQHLRNIPNLRLTLGPYNTSFFVHDESACLWMNLPLPLLNALQSRIKNGAWIDKPRIVALGASSNFLLITQNHAAFWDLSQYRTLSHMLEFSKTQDHGIQEVKTVILHPYRFQGFVAQSWNGTLIYENLPSEAMGGMNAMRAAIMKDTKEGDRRKSDLGAKRGESVQRRPSARKQEILRREWRDRKERFRAEARGLKLSLSLSISAGEIGFGGSVG
ncbi:hypothetical protein CC78DRAFT_535794 [Lojkania enalia]|uniref:Uncharacterized protein n=1 Tax=Lojkania enalia TaxID=147567 RepID=A0A9P4K5E3_9PLEO|nr:hypothetical protein CC78DRAFT_535794 [Didymosphaeria enalia]